MTETAATGTPATGGAAAAATGTPATGTPAAGGAAATGTPGAAATGMNQPAPFDWATAGGVTGEDLTYVQAKGFKGPNDLLASYKGAEKLIGVPADQVIKLPQSTGGVEITQQQMNEAVYDRLGRPKTAADYKLPVPEGVDVKFAENVSGWMHEVGLNTKQATTLAGKWNEYMAGVAKAQTEATTARAATDNQALKVEWGNKYDSNVALVDRAAAAFGMDQKQVTALRDAMGPAAAMKFLLNIGSKLGHDDNFVPAGDNQGFTGMSPEQAMTEIATLRKDKGFQEKFTKGDAEAKAKWTKLHQTAYPGVMTV